MVKELHKETGISERTIRDKYWELRRKLFDAVQADKTKFNSAGRFLYPHRDIEYQGVLLMEAVAKSDAFAALVELQFPGNRQASDEQAGLLVIEMAVRVLCKSPSMPRTLGQAAEPIVKCAQEAQAIIAKIEAVQDDLANRWKAGGMKIELEHKLMELDLLKLQQNLEAVTSDHRSSIDPSDMIFNNLRSYLAKHPI